MSKYWIDKTPNENYINAEDFNSAFAEIDDDVQDLSDNTYRKSETDNAINSQIGQFSTDVNQRIGQIYDDVYIKSQTYSKTETDNEIGDQLSMFASYFNGQLAVKANSNDVYPKAQTYSKTEVDDLIAGAGGGGGVRTCRFVVGTSTAGWTADDCDFLCDGTADNAEIIAAINALPSGGGEVVLLDGTYNFYQWDDGSTQYPPFLQITRSNVTLRGSGIYTKINQQNDMSPGHISVSGASNVTIRDMAFSGGTDTYCILLSGCWSCVLENLDISRMQVCPILVSGGASSRIRIQNNYIHSDYNISSGSIISMSKAHYCIVSGNIILNGDCIPVPYGSDGYPIFINSDCSNGLVVNNITSGKAPTNNAGASVIVANNVS